jgi:hypothetical protein
VIRPSSQPCSENTRTWPDFSSFCDWRVGHEDAVAGRRRHQQLRLVGEADLLTAQHPFTTGHGSHIAVEEVHPADRVHSAQVRVGHHGGAGTAACARPEVVQVRRKEGAAGRDRHRHGDRVAVAQGKVDDHVPGQLVSPQPAPEEDVALVGRDVRRRRRHGQGRHDMTWPDLGSTFTIVWFDVPMSKVSFDA